MLRALFFLLLALALLGDARIFIFLVNRLVFGSHREEKSPLRWLVWAVPPLLLYLTLLFWPLHAWVVRLAAWDPVERFTPAPIERVIWSIFWAKLGAGWLFVAAGVGLYWIVDRIRVLIIRDDKPPGTRTLPSEVIRLRKQHVPFAWLRNLGAHNDVYDIEVTRHEVFIDDLPPAFDGYRIAFLTDTHVARFVRRDFFETVVAQANRFDPDLVLLGGDFVTFHRHIPLMAETLLADLRARDGIFAVLGNHDYWSGAKDVEASMTARGAQFITNKVVLLRRGDAELPLIGIDEVYRGEPDIEGVFARVRSGPRIGLTHHPDLIDDLRGRRIDLLVCGHTHGGQIRFPFFGAVIVPSRHESRYASGFHRVGDVLLYVSRGIGAIPPIRILCKPEVATFILRRTHGDVMPSVSEASGWSGAR
jgi:predicted MPP superfamily phosphohydrolase